MMSLQPSGTSGYYNFIVLIFFFFFFFLWFFKMFYFFFGLNTLLVPNVYPSCAFGP